MFSGSEDGTVKIWDLRAPGFQREYESRAAVNTVVLHPNSGELISGNIRPPLVEEITAVLGAAAAVRTGVANDLQLLSSASCFRRTLEAGSSHCNACTAQPAHMLLYPLDNSAALLLLKHRLMQAILQPAVQRLICS